MASCNQTQIPLNREMKLGSLLLSVFVMLAGCTRSNIWNAVDLSEWVKDQAAKESIVRESIQLDDWYHSEGGKNV